MIVPFAKLISKNGYLSIMQWLEQRLKNKKKYSLEDYDGFWHSYLEPSWFNDIVSLEFNGTKFPAPGKYELVLEQLYGKDWRTPIKREVAQHGNAYFINGFDENLVIKNLKEAKDIYSA